MISLLKFVLNAQFIIGVILGGLVGRFIVPLILKENK